MGVKTENITAWKCEVCGCYLEGSIVRAPEPLRCQEHMPIDPNKVLDVQYHDDDDGGEDWDEEDGEEVDEDDGDLDDEDDDEEDDDDDDDDDFDDDDLDDDDDDIPWPFP